MSLRDSLSLLLLPLSTLVACTASVPPSEGREPAAVALDHEHVLGEGDVVIKNASLKLARAYWTVVRRPNGDHYVLPRPDGDSTLVAECAGGAPLAAKLAERALCRAAESQAEAAKVNALDGAFALEVSSVLHRDLRFHRVGTTIAPHPLGRDILELCRTRRELRDGLLKSRCDEEAAFAKGTARPAMVRLWSEAELEQVPAALNTLYGVPD